MYQGWILTFHRLREDRRGAILPMAAVTVLIMFMLAGLAIDVSMIIAAKNRVRRAMDAAGIAIATNFRDDADATQEEVEAFTVKWMQANFPTYKLGEYFDLNVNWVDGTADISAKVRVDTVFMDVVGATEINADVGVRVISETRGLEVAIAVDNTGSMNGTEMVWLRASVNKFIDTLYANTPDASQVKVGIVPFVAAVNVKDPGEFATWINEADPEDVVYMDDDITALEPLVPYHGDYYNPRRSHAFLYKLSATASGKPHWYDQWKGCVEARAITHNGKELDLEDVPPDPSVPETLFVPYLWPDGPDLGGSSGTKDSSFTLITSNASLWDGSTLQTPNNYLNDLVDASFTWSQRLESVASWLNATEVLNVEKSRAETAPITGGPSMACPEHILPMTSDASYLKDKINNKHLDFFHNGGTNIPQGVMWAWRVLSEAPPFTQGAAYVNDDGTENRKFDKIILLFVDGGNGIVYNDNPMYSNYSAYGYVKPDGRLDPAGVNDLNTKTRKVCQNAREPAPGFSREKILIYAIAFDVDSSSPIIDLLRDCTGSIDQVFIAEDTTELYQTFESLAQQLTKLRVVY